MIFSGFFFGEEFGEGFGFEFGDTFNRSLFLHLIRNLIQYRFIYSAGIYYYNISGMIIVPTATSDGVISLIFKVTVLIIIPRAS